MVPPGPHLDLVGLVPIWGSPGPGSFGLHLPQLKHNDSDPYLNLYWTCLLWSLPGHLWELDTLLYNWASPGSVDSGPHLDLTWIW